LILSLQVNDSCSLSFSECPCLVSWGEWH